MLRNPGLRKSVEQPVLDLNFAASQIGSNGAPDSRIDFSRGNNAWFVDSDGLVKKSPHNVLQQSQTFDTTWGETGCSVTANSINAPDGTLTGYKLIKNAAFGFASLSQNVTLTVTAGRATVTVYAKADERDKIALREGAVTGGYAAFDLTNGTILDETNVNEASITSVGNGWFRILIDVTLSSGTTFGVRIVPLPDSYTSGSVTASFSDDGTSGVYIWGSQASEHSYDLLPVGNPYIKTEGSAAYAARLDHDPTWFMSAPQEQNLLRYSEMLDQNTGALQWSLEKTTITANATTDPLGGTTAEKMTETTDTGAHTVRTPDFDITEGVSYTFSAYIKAVPNSPQRTVRIDLRGVNSGFVFSKADFTLPSFTPEGTDIGVGSSVEEIGNGWFRISVSATATATIDNAQGNIVLGLGPAQFNNYAGDTDAAIFVWGAQIEVGTSPGTYHRTEGAPYYGPGATPKGLLIEEQRANLAPDSDNFTSNSGSTRAADKHLAPDGTITSDEFTISSTTDSHQIGWQSLSNSLVTVGTVHAVSFFAKLINGTPNLGVRGFGRGGFNQYPIFDLNAGTVVNVGSAWESGTSIEDFGNGWFRCKCIVNPSAQFGPLIHMLESGDTEGNLNHLGNGTDKVAIWGGQLEVGSFPTSHIQTTGSTATRNADVAVMGPTTGGTELVTNGTFDTDSDWTLSTGWSITGGEAVASSAAQFRGITSTTLSLVAGRRYRASMDVASYTAGSVNMRYREGGSTIANTGDKSATGTFTLDFTCTDAASPDINIQTRSSGSNTFAIDNASVRELYPFEQYNPAEGTLVAEGELIGSGSNFSSVVALYQEDADDNYFINTLWDSGNSIIKTAIKDSTTQGSPSPSVGGDTWDGGDSFRVANLYAENSLNIALDGYIGVDDTSVTVPGVDQLGIFQASINFQSVKHSGYMKRVTYYDRRISNITAQNLTSD